MDLNVKQILKKNLQKIMKFQEMCIKMKTK